MLIYILVAFFPFIVAPVKINFGKEKINKLIKIIISSLPMFLLIALRAPSLGADTGMYLRDFNETVDMPWDKLFENTREEHGFRVFVKLITYITQSELVYQIIYTTIYFIGVVSFTNNLDFNPTLFLFLFATTGVYTFMFTGVRQCLAMSICLFSYKFIKKRKLLPFLLCVALAFTFHKSSIFFVVVYFIYSFTMTAYSAIFYILIALLIAIFLEPLQAFLNDQLEYNYGIESTDNGVIFFAFILLLMVVSVYLILYNKRTSRQSVGLFNGGVITVIFWFLRLFTRVAERPSYYFMFFACAFISYAFLTIKSREERAILQAVLVAICLSYYLYRFTASASMLVPYQFYFL